MREEFNMPKAGDRMTSVETGETFTFIETAADSNGERLVVDMEIAPGGGAKAAPIHFHPNQDERFTITKGSVHLWLNGKESVHGAGECVMIPAGAAHTWHNNGDGELRFRLEIEPAGYMEAMFERLCGQSQRGLLSKNGQMALLSAAVGLHACPDTLYLPRIPIWLQKNTFAALAFVGRLCGYKEHYPYFEETIS
jgi:quercetin dioxygenase-like cupin family protein